MCGIAGIIYFNRERRVEPPLITKMTDILIHRGPDDSGIFIDHNLALGSRRLKVIDLSSAAHQPMCNEDETIWCVFNGEIYNFKYLRVILKNLGHHFKSDSDTEVIIHAYEEYGRDCVLKLNGMFAFAIWDKRSKELFCARDRVGEKPFYYYCDREKFIFASEIKAILVDKSIKKEIDPVALDSYFSYMYIPEPYSIFSGIKKLPPAHVLALKDNRINIEKYWDLDFSGQQPIRQISSYVEELKPLVMDSIRIRLVSDVPLGVFLSGGIDSSTIVAFASQLSPERLKTFSIACGKGKFNENPYARIVAKKFNTDHCEYTVAPEDIAVLLPKLIRAIDEPFADSSIIPTYYISKICRQKVTVALSGEGGDEIFGGYPWYRRNFQIKLARQLMPSRFIRHSFNKLSAFICGENPYHKNRFINYACKARRFSSLSLMPAAECYDMTMSLFTPDFKKNIFIGGLNSLGSDSAIKTVYNQNNARHWLDKSLYTDQKTYLTGDLLVKADRMSMVNSLELRAPFLDYRIIELGAKIPANLKIKNGITKYILREIIKGCVPDEIVQRREKRGFSIPVGEWLNAAVVGNFTEEVLLDKKTLRRGIFSEDGIRNIIKDRKQLKVDLSNYIWALLIFEIWAREYLDD
jgi:asparagine synthase (glutamine-hydrolysing)